MGTSNADELMNWAELSQHPDGGTGVTQLLAPCWGQRTWIPAVCIGTMEEIKLESSLKHLHCQEGCGESFQSPLSPAILPHAGLAL